jgi:ACS family D-galactonate transporter-like MFS transporter
MLSEVAPREFVGQACGLFNFFANLAGIHTPILIGFIVEVTSSYTGALVYVGEVALVGTYF